MNTKKPYRQGDILLKPIEAIPANATIKPRENGKIVLAHGVSTGRNHVIEDESAVCYVHPEHPGFSFLQIDEEGAKLGHGEHGAIAIPAGAYIVIRQTVHTQGEIRNVID